MTADTMARLSIEAALDQMRSAVDGFKSGSMKRPRHGNGFVEIIRPVVNSAKYVRMKIDHRKNVLGFKF